MAHKIAIFSFEISGIILLLAQIEEMDEITTIDPDVRGIVERNWPHLLSKLPPED